MYFVSGTAQVEQSRVDECKPLDRGAQGGHHRSVPGQGEAVQVEPMKPTLKAPGTERWKLKHSELLSNFAFRINLRRYIKVRDMLLKEFRELRHAGAEGLMYIKEDLILPHVSHTFDPPTIPL